MKLVITGAAGQLARRVTELGLTKVRATDLIVTTRTPPALAALASRGVAVHYADFVEPRSLTTAFAGAERLLLVSTSNLHERDAQHRAAIDAAKAAGVRHIIYTSGLK